MILPESICKLQNLQTLKLKELMRKIKNLVSLRHPFEIDGCYELSHMPCGLGQLTSLHTLTRFVVGSKDRSAAGMRGGLSELEGLVNLRGKLSIEGLRGSIAKTWKIHPTHYYLDRLEFLESLVLLSWDSEDPITVTDDENLLLLPESLRPHPNLKKLMIGNYGGKSFPSWMMVNNICLSLRNLVEISLSSCNSWKHLTPFGLHPSIQVMRICYLDSLEYNCKEEEEGGCCSSGGDYNTRSSPTSSMSRGLFPFLKSLYLMNLKRLKGLGNRRWKVLPIGTTTRSLSFGAMPHLTALEYVYIENCPQFGLLGN